MRLLLLRSRGLHLLLRLRRTARPNSIKRMSSRPCILHSPWNLVLGIQRIRQSLRHRRLLQRTCRRPHNVANIVRLSKILPRLVEKRSQPLGRTSRPIDVRSHEILGHRPVVPHRSLSGSVPLNLADLDLGIVLVSMDVLGVQRVCGAFGLEVCMGHVSVVKVSVVCLSVMGQILRFRAIDVGNFHDRTGLIVGLLFGF